MSFKSSALFFCLLCLKCWGLDWLVRSHSRISVGATRGSIWVMTIYFIAIYEKTHFSHLIIDVLVVMTSRFWGIIDVEF